LSALDSKTFVPRALVPRALVPRALPPVIAAELMSFADKGAEPVSQIAWLR
jgi:hypothetical protein